MTDKQKYISYCDENQDNIPLFMQTWYLEIVCGVNWDVLAFCRNNLPIAFMPYFIHKKYGFTSIRPPLFSPYQGIVLDKNNYIDNQELQQNKHRLYKLENEICEYFASAIDNMKLSACFYSFVPTFFCSSPFIRKNFSANIRYTYRIDLSNPDLFTSFSPVIRKKLRKAENELFITTENYDLKEIFSILTTTYTRQNTSIPYSYEVFCQIVSKTLEKHIGKMFVCKDNRGNICSVLFIAWDKTTAYSLIGGNNYNNVQRDSGALIQYKSIKYAQSLGLTTYDFEGSMLKGIEEFFQHFGGIRTPYISLSKFYNKFYKYLMALKH